MNEEKELADRMAEAIQTLCHSQHGADSSQWPDIYVRLLEEWGKQEIGTQHLLTGSEAVYGFCAWLTIRQERTVMGASELVPPIPDLIQGFCELNGLVEPRDNYTDYLTLPSDVQIIDAG